MSDVLQILTLIGVVGSIVSFGWRLGRMEGRLDQIEKRIERLENILDPKKGGEKCGTSS
jgi:hypothetical protein